jgi:modulator of FtsH protease
VNHLRKLEPQLRQKFVIRVILGQMAALPFVIAGITMLVGGGGGLYWLVPAVIFSFLVSLLDAWVLLVEINR